MFAYGMAARGWLAAVIERASHQMKFQTEELDETTVLIKRDEGMVAGSIVRVGDH